MNIIKKNSLKHRIVALVLLLAMSVGMATSMGRKADAAGWTVTINYYNGQAKDTRTNIPANSYITLPVPNATANATFLGWKCGNDMYTAGKPAKIVGNMDFYGVWQSLVNFYDYNGRQIDQRAERTSYKYSLPSAPTRAGYTFDGWYSSTGEKVTPETTVTKAYKHDLTARYKITPGEACKVIDKKLNGNHTYAKEKSDESYKGYMALITNGSDTLCTICAKADLLNRRLVLDDFRNGTNIYSSGYAFNIRDAIVGSCGGNLSGITYHGKSGDNYKFTYSGYDKIYGNKTATFTNGWYASSAASKYKKTYTYENVRYFAYGKDLSTVKADLKALLKQHPEGIYIYTCVNTTDPTSTGGYKSPHGILLVNYDDNYFYAVDTGGVRRDTLKKDYDSTCKLDNTFLNSIYAKNKDTGAKRYKDADDILHHIIAYGYIR